MLAELADGPFDGSASDLATLLHLSPAQVSAAISTLCSDGTVCREPDRPGVVATRLWLRGDTDGPAGSAPSEVPAPEPTTDYRPDLFARPVTCSADCGCEPEACKLTQLAEAAAHPNPDALVAKVRELAADLGVHANASMADAADAIRNAVRMPEPVPAPRMVLPHPGERGGGSLHALPTRPENPRATLPEVSASGHMRLQLVVDLCDGAGSVSVRVDTPWPVAGEDDARLIGDLAALVGAYYARQHAREHHAQG